MIIKDIEIKLEVGAYDNFMTLIPRKILEKTNKISLIRFNYINSNKIIDLWSDNSDIDFYSFD